MKCLQCNVVGSLVAVTWKSCDCSSQLTIDISFLLLVTGNQVRAEFQAVLQKYVIPLSLY